MYACDAMSFYRVDSITCTQHHTLRRTKLQPGVHRAEHMVQIRCKKMRYRRIVGDRDLYSLLTLGQWIYSRTRDTTYAFMHNLDSHALITNNLTLQEQINKSITNKSITNQ